MKSLIRILSSELASQIAAGEVVARPSSVVKELLENALDAGASRVDVSIEGGGITSIEVVDDGRGMNRKDLSLCLQRHATSKLKKITDLEEIESYGFRGEALPSIASVSRFSIKTRSADSDSGLHLLSDGGAKPEIAPVGIPVGTSMSVKDLFFNVPARRKFLRASNTESGHVGDVLSEAALARCDVSFSLTRDGRRHKKFSKVSSFRERVEQVLGEEDLVECVGQRGPLRVEAYLCSPRRARRGSSGLKVLVNGRPVRDRALTGTIAHAYGASLERGYFPRGVVYLSLPGRLVDVNVHPQKTEVRFASLRAVLDALHSVVDRGMSGGRGQSDQEARPESAGKTYPSASSSPSLPRVLHDGPSPVSGQRYAKGRAAKVVSVPLTTLGRATKTATAPRKERKGAEEGPAPGVTPPPSQDLPRPPTRAQKKSGQRGNWQGLRFLGQAASSYLLCEGVDGIHILDQHAADEIYVRDQLQVAFDAGQIPSQVILFPAVVELSSEACDRVAAHGEDLARLGIDVRVRTGGSVSVHGVPRLLSKIGAEELLTLLLEQAIGKKISSLLDFQQAISSMACLGAIRSGETVSRSTAEELLRGLRRADFESSCIHGRPLLTSVPFSELLRKAGKK